MTKSFIFSFLFVSTLTVPSWAGEKYVGLWGGEAQSSFEFISKKPLTINYCFKGQCNKVKALGKIDAMTFLFPKNGSFPGATMVMNKVGSTYWGTYVFYGTSDVSIGSFSLEK